MSAIFGRFPVPGFPKQQAKLPRYFFFDLHRLAQCSECSPGVLTGQVEQAEEDLGSNKRVAGRGVTIMRLDLELDASAAGEPQQVFCAHKRERRRLLQEIRDTIVDD